MKLPALGLATILITGCSMIPQGGNAPPTVAVDCPIPDHKDPTLDLGNPEPISWKDVNFIIITPDNVDEKFAELEEDQVVFFAIKDNGYEALSMNMAELKRYIKDQKAIIGAYKKYFEEKK